MKVDVIIPCYNAINYIGDTLSSVFDQNYSDYNIIIIDDGSTDGTRDYLRKISSEHNEITVVYNTENQGVAKVRNQGIEISRADYIVFLDADDLMPSYRLEKQIRYLQEHPECDILAGNYQQLVDGKKGLKTQYGELSSELVYAGLMFENIIATSTCVFKRKFVIDNNIRFDDSLITLEDYNFWLDCAINHAVFFVMDEILAYYRIVDSGLSRSNSSPEKIRQRNQDFDRLHNKFLLFYQVKLNACEQKIFLQYTHEDFEVKTMSIVERIVFLGALLKLSKSNVTDSKAIRKWNKKIIWRVLQTW